MLPTPSQCAAPQPRNVRSITHDVKRFSQNLIFQNTNPLPVETELYSTHTIPLLREHLDSYLHYISYKIYDITPSQPQVQVFFNPVETIIQEYTYTTKQYIHKPYKNQYKNFSINIRTN